MRHAASTLSLLLAAGIQQSYVSAYAVPEIVFNGKSQGSLGAVACEATECSAIGTDLLARGGNAVDAIVGTTFCVGVIGMYHSGIGGGGFALVRDADGNYEAVDFRESAPADASEDMYKDRHMDSVIGGLSVAVPGEVRGLEYLHKKYGSLPWKQVMQGAIHVSRNGFRVNGDLVAKMQGMFDLGLRFLVDDPIWAADFAPNGTLVQEGDIMTRKNYANTLERIANEGSDALYYGEIAQNIVDFVQERNGNLTLKDIQDYKVNNRPVKSVKFRGFEVNGMSSPASGAVAMQMLKLMEKYDADDVKDGNLTAHRLTEAMRFSYAARGYLGDPSFVEHRDVLEYEDHMLNPKTIADLHKRILDNTTLPPEDYYPGDVYQTESHGTSHLSSADKSGMAVSLTTTINLLFGAQIMEPKSGIILNDEMNDFSIPGVRNEFGFEPSEANFIRPHKRPLSSMTPLIATYPDGSLFAVIGAGGGSRIISSTAQTLWRMVEEGATMTEALRHGRLHDQVSPNKLLLEREWFPFADATAEELRRKGHEVEFVKPGLSSAQGIKRLDDGVFEAVGEPRQVNSGGLTV